MIQRGQILQYFFKQFFSNRRQDCISACSWETSVCNTNYQRCHLLLDKAYNKFDLLFSCISTAVLCLLCSISVCSPQCIFAFLAPYLQKQRPWFVALTMKRFIICSQRSVFSLFPLWVVLLLFDQAHFLKNSAVIPKVSPKVKTICWGYEAIQIVICTRNY